MASFTDYNAQIHFSDIEEAFNKMNVLEDGWVKVKGRRNLCFFYLNELPENCENKLSMYLSADLSVQVHFGELRIEKIICTGNSIFNLPLRVSDINTLCKL